MNPCLSFPIIIDYKLRNYSGIREVPWNFVEQGRQRIEANHGQTLERLAQRGGLCWYELHCGLTNNKLDFKSKLDHNYFEAEVKRLLQEWLATSY